MSEKKLKIPKRHELRICPSCGGYMKAQGTVGTDVIKHRRHWQDSNYRRGFGGRELKVFVCEKCGHQDTYQVDPLHYIKEDGVG